MVLSYGEPGTCREFRCHESPFDAANSQEIADIAGNLGQTAFTAFATAIAPLQLGPVAGWQYALILISTLSALIGLLVLVLVTDTAQATPRALGVRFLGMMSAGNGGETGGAPLQQANRWPGFYSVHTTFFKLEDIVGM